MWTAAHKELTNAPLPLENQPPQFLSRRVQKPVNSKGNHINIRKKETVSIFCGWDSFLIDIIL